MVSSLIKSVISFQNYNLVVVQAFSQISQIRLSSSVSVKNDSESS